MPIQCPQCKALNRDTATFCDTCGSKLVISTSPEFTSPIPPVQPSPTPPVESAPPTAAPLAYSSKPTSLPEEHSQTSFATTAPAAYQPAAYSAMGSTIPLPMAKYGPPQHRHPWRWYFITLCAAIGIGGIVGYMMNTPPRTDYIFMMCIFFGGLVLVVGFFIALSRDRPVMSTGVVTHMQPWMPNRLIPGQIGLKESPNWIFNLRFIDKSGQPSLDAKGFTQPVVEVEFRDDKVHGPPLEEGCLVVVRGKYLSGRFRAREIWNGQKGSETPILGTFVTYYGLAVGKQERQVPDMRYPGSGLQVWSFLIQPTDSSFNLLRDSNGSAFAALPVEIRARSISGPLNQSDRVKIIGQMARGIIYSKEITNVSAGGAQVTVREWAGVS